MTFSRPLEIIKLIDQSCDRRSISRTALLQAAGYRNATKGLRRLEQLARGDFHGARGLIEALTRVLDIDDESLAEAIAADKTRLAAEEALAQGRTTDQRRAMVQPNAIIETQTLEPRVMSMLLAMSVGHSLNVNLAVSPGSPSFIDQALQAIELRKTKEGTIGSFGRPTGFIVNYNPDLAVRYDLQGREVERLSAMISPGTVIASIEKGCSIIDLVHHRR